MNQTNCSNSVSAYHNSNHSSSDFTSSIPNYDSNNSVYNYTSNSYVGPPTCQSTNRIISNNMLTAGSKQPLETIYSGVQTGCENRGKFRQSQMNPPVINVTTADTNKKYDVHSPESSTVIATHVRLN